MRITRRQLRKIIRESIDIVNTETGELLVFGDEDGDAAPEAAVPELAKRLGLDLSPNDDSLLSNEDWEALEAETVGKRGERADKVTSARIKSDRDRLDPDKLLSRLSDWASTASKEFMADNPSADLQDIAYDLADSAEYAFEPDEWEELLWHFDEDVNALQVYAAESMG